MSMIEGLGDDVINLIIIAIISVVVIVAWMTTDIRHSINGGTVYLLNHRRINRNQRLTSYTESSTISEGTADLSSTNTNSEEAERIEGSVADAATEIEGDSGPVEIIRAMDVDETSIIRRRRLQYLEGQNNETVERETESVQELQETDDCTTESSTQLITIKLKYLNDDLKIVDGDLKEQLGDFKRRHFQMEMSSNKLVRLIFNGQVLQRDSETLQSYGIFDNCVVHCLIHQRRNANNENVGAGGDNSNPALSNNNNNNIQRDWDLGNLLVATVSCSLSSAWYFRYQYPQLFTLTATVGLVAITGLFSVISFRLYFPESVTRSTATTNQQSAADNVGLTSGQQT